MLRSPAKSGTTKNLMVGMDAKILRSAQNDIEEFPDGYWTKSIHSLWSIKKRSAEVCEKLVKVKLRDIILA
jgi:hypothetical protein